MKIITIIGARPQFIKAAIVSKSLQDTTVKEIIIHSGQHYDKYMSDIFFSEMGITDPQYKLNINQNTAYGRQASQPPCTPRGWRVLARVARGGVVPRVVVRAIIRAEFDQSGVVAIPEQARRLFKYRVDDFTYAEG